MSKCKSDEILNPASNRCVKKLGKIGKKLLKGKFKDCKEDEIRNPHTNRCVKKTGAIGKKIVEETKNVRRPSVSRRSVSRRSVNATKILNPATNRYVNIDGVIGRKILESQRNNIATVIQKFYPGYKIRYKGKDGVVTARYMGTVQNVYEIRLNNGQIKDFVDYKELELVSEK